MEKKYELTDETIEWNGRTLHRIRALRDVGKPQDNICKGDLGGFVESEENLSHEGNCWIYNDGKVYENARVIENAYLEDSPEIYGNALIQDYSHIAGYNVKIFGNAIITGCSKVYAGSIYDKAILIDSEVWTDYKIYGSTRIIKSKIYFEDDEHRPIGLIHGDTIICGTVIYGNCRIYDNAQIYNAEISDCDIHGTAQILCNKNIINNIFECRRFYTGIFTGVDDNLV